MSKAIFILFLSMVLGGCTFTNPWVKKPAGLEVITNPTSTVYLNGKNVGDTPYRNQNITPGEYTLKLIPSSVDSNSSLNPWETKLTLSREVTTIINRTFQSSDVDSESSILELQKDVSSSKTFLSVISDPDTVNINLDGQSHGFTPLSKLEVSPGAHTLDVSSPGYKSQKLSLNTVKGYNLIVNVKLGGLVINLTPPPVATPSTEATGSASLSTPVPTPTPMSSPSPKASVGTIISKPYVVIGKTETGWLRVRKDPSSTGAELGKVYENDKLPYLSSSDSGWFEVTYLGQSAWLSSKYATLVQ